MLLSRDEVEAVLRAELDSAFEGLEKTSEPGGKMVNRKVGEEKRDAIRRLRTALDRFDGFVLDGKVPPDLNR